MSGNSNKQTTCNNGLNENKVKKFATTCEFGLASRM